MPAERVPAAVPPAGASQDRPGTILQNGRRKAYRPIPPDRRRAALEEGVAAYARGDFFEAHELLEPAWMGTSDLAERALYQGLIKLAAAYVHVLRGNPIGLVRNLKGAQMHLATSLQLDPSFAVAAGVDLPRLLAEVDARLTAAATLPERLAYDPTAMLDLVPDAPRMR